MTTSGLITTILILALIAGGIYLVLRRDQAGVGTTGENRADDRDERS
ncbi:MAG: hypothetical protein QMC81_08845 [Thermoanaerobacterales bacterium]|nr:hypothetical protein [Bacillota bacterium]MDI6907575.1 hypothetical protein [Thermoanaerobacterales bacterium]